MKIISNNNLNFGWDLRTHLHITEHALDDNDTLSRKEKRMIARCSQMPDLIEKEIEDVNAAHFYDPLHEDPSYGTKNDDVNNAMSKFLYHTEEAMNKLKLDADTDKKREEFMREVGYAVHYLQDASTPPHTEAGNYAQKLFRLPMHINFECGLGVGASWKLDKLKANHTPEELPFSTLKMLFHNTALFTVQEENKVKYKNLGRWPEIQQRCYDRGVNASKAYLDYILQYLPQEPKQIDYMA